MASVSRTCSGSSGSKYTIRLYYVLNSQSISGNTSNVTVYATLQRNDGYANSAYNGYESQNHTTLSVAGTTRVDKDFVLDTRNSRVQELSRWTGNIAHNADGTKTIALSASFTSALSTLTGGSVSASWTLPAIPRKSGVSLSPRSLRAGQALTITAAPASSAFTHTASVRLGSRSLSVSFAAGETSKAVTIPTEWANGIGATATTAAGSVTLTTRSGSTSLGTSTASFTLYLPEGTRPSAGTLSVTRVDGEVPADWGVYVQGYSKATAALSGAAGVYGSTIRAYALSGGGYSSTAASLTTGPLNTAGTVTFTGRVTDSRGQTASATRSITVQAYAPPRFGAVRLYRCDASGAADPGGAYAAIEAAFSFSSVGGKNTAAGSYRLAPSGGGGALTGSFASGEKTVVSGVDTERSYTVTLTAADALSSASYTAALSTAATTMDFLAGGRGVAFGKVAETENLLDVAFDARFRGGAAFDAPAAVLGGLGVEDYITEAGSNANGYYWKFASGRMVCWVRKAFDTPTWETWGSTGLKRAYYSWTYPVAFTSAPTVALGVCTNGYVMACVGSVTNTTGQARMLTPTGSSPIGFSLHGVALGSWR